MMLTSGSLVPRVSCASASKRRIERERHFSEVEAFDTMLYTASVPTSSLLGAAAGVCQAISA